MYSVANNDVKNSVAQKNKKITYSRISIYNICISGKHFRCARGGRSLTESALLNHMIDGALGHHTDSAAGGGLPG